MGEKEGGTGDKKESVRLCVRDCVCGYMLSSSDLLPLLEKI